MFKVLWAGYGVLREGKTAGSKLLARRTVPSGGGIYGLRIFYVSLRALPGVSRGIYEVHHRIDQSVGLRRLPGTIDGFLRASSDPGQLRFASGVVVVGGAFSVSARKYDNRSVLLATLEAGHVAQNTLLAAAEAGIGALESASFIEHRLRALLRLADGTMPLTMIAIGANPTHNDVAALEVWTNPRFHWIDFRQHWADSGLHVAATRVERGNRESNWCWGRARSAREAYDKALAEAQERLACGSPQRLYKAKLADLPRAIDPRHLVSYDAAQYRARGFPFAPFEEARAYWWRDGVSCRTGRSVPLLADCVYFADALPTPARRRPYTRANTSGVAAYPTFEGAVERATFELLERDAFMRAWMARATPPEIPMRALPGLAQRRIRALAEGGIRVTVKNISAEIVPVVLVFSQHERRAATKVTAAAAYDPEQAIEHALTELEPRWYLQLEQDELPRIKPEEVFSTGDHDTLYSQRRYFRRADALARPAMRHSLQDVRKGLCKKWPDVLDALRARAREAVCVDITPPGSGLDQGRSPLRVARVLVPGLLPMSFGYNQEPWGTFLSLNPAARSRTTFPTRVFPHPFA
jgi:ribosomal protein S12 methylthiotransferase accessory factor